MTAPTTETNPPTVLIVDDERETADLFATFLEDRYEVVTAYGGEEALERFGPNVDVVLLDRRMPDVHGDAVLEDIRSQDGDCRVVMVTAIDPDTDVIGLEFDDYLVKPVTMEAVRKTVDQMLHRAALDEHLQEALSLASKMATLESKMDIDELEESEEYAELVARFDEFRDLLAEIASSDDLYGEFSAVKMEALFADV